MAIQFSEFLTDINSGIYALPVLNTILSSVIYTSFTLSILIIIIMMFICPVVDIPAWAFGKTFIYLFIVNTLVLSMHYSLMSSKHSEKVADRNNTEFISNINKKTGGYIYDKDTIKVMPNFQSQSYPDEPDEQEILHQQEQVYTTVTDMLDSVEKAL